MFRSRTVSSFEILMAVSYGHLLRLKPSRFAVLACTENSVNLLPSYEGEAVTLIEDFKKGRKVMLHGFDLWKQAILMREGESKNFFRGNVVFECYASKEFVPFKKVGELIGTQEGRSPLSEKRSRAIAFQFIQLEIPRMLAEKNRIIEAQVLSA